MLLFACGWQGTLSSTVIQSVNVFPNTLFNSCPLKKQCPSSVILPTQLLLIVLFPRVLLNLRAKLRAKLNFLYFLILLKNVQVKTIKY